jgi:hypothetical protein
MTTETTTTTNSQLTEALAYYYPCVPEGEARTMFLDACATALIDAPNRGVSLTLPLQLK